MIWVLTDSVHDLFHTKKVQERDFEVQPDDLRPEIARSILQVTDEWSSQEFLKIHSVPV